MDEKTIDAMAAHISELTDANRALRVERRVLADTLSVLLPIVESLAEAAHVNRSERAAINAARAVLAKVSA